MRQPFINRKEEQKNLEDYKQKKSKEKAEWNFPFKEAFARIVGKK